jgi:hypothetical protein
MLKGTNQYTLYLMKKLMKPLNAGLAHECIQCQDVLMASATVFFRFQSLLRTKHGAPIFAE